MDTCFDPRGRWCPFICEHIKPPGSALKCPSGTSRRLEIQSVIQSVMIPKITCIWRVLISNAAQRQFWVVYNDDCCLRVCCSIIHCLSVTSGDMLITVCLFPVQLKESLHYAYYKLYLGIKEMPFDLCTVNSVTHLRWLGKNRINKSFGSLCNPPPVCMWCTH